MGGRKIDLVDSGNDIKICVHRERCVRDRLSLDSLRCIDDEHSALAGSERARDLIGEIDMAGGVDQIELIVLSIVGSIDDTNCIRFDRDAALALDIHSIEQLRFHIAFVHSVRQLENTIRNRGLTVVDMRDNRKIADML